MVQITSHTNNHYFCLDLNAQEETMKPINVNDPTPKSKSNFSNMTPSVTSSTQKHGNYVGKNMADKNMM